MKEMIMVIKENKCGIVALPIRGNLWRKYSMDLKV